jgi:hypothetical protein
MSGAEIAGVADVIRATLAESGLDWVEHGGGAFEVDLPGERKLKTTCRLEVGKHALGIHAFVARRPDENHEVVYRWMLERNLRMFGVAFAVDASGDIYLDGRLPLSAVTPDELDRVMGAVLTYADESFNVILDLGFATSIRREWAWRESRGESTENLKAFQHLRPEASTGGPA